MNQSLYQKIVIAVGILAGLIVVIVIVIVIQLSLRQDHLLIDYLPEQIDFWFWQKNGGFSDKSAETLKQLGADANIIAGLQNQTSEVVVYYLNDRWFKLGDSGKKTSSKKEGADIVGFLSRDYVGKRLAGFEHIFKPGAYYFALKQTDDVLYFSFIHQEAIKFKQLAVFEPQKRPIEFLNDDIILAAKLQDQVLLNSIVDALKSNIVNFTAFDYPVIISKTLPDQTIITEKLVKPELFVWQESDPHVYQLNLNQSETERHQVTNQIKNFNSDYHYYQDRETVIFALTGNLSATAVFDGIDATNFIYLNLLADSNLVDILGKSKMLSWLQNLEAKGIMIYDDGKMMQGGIEFNK